MIRPRAIRWLPAPEDHDYDAAREYLLLSYSEVDANRIVDALAEQRNISHFKAKDIFRASGLSLLGVSEEHVKRDRKKIRDGKKLSPILLVRMTAHHRLIVADGYHRLCSVYFYNQDAEIPCKIVEG